MRTYKQSILALCEGQTHQLSTVATSFPSRCLSSGQNWDVPGSSGAWRSNIDEFWGRMAVFERFLDSPIGLVLGTELLLIRATTEKSQHLTHLTKLFSWTRAELQEGIRDIECD